MFAAVDGNGVLKIGCYEKPFAGRIDRVVILLYLFTGILCFLVRGLIALA